MAHLRVHAEIGGDGGCLFYTFDPPGLLARGASFEEALAAAPAEAARLRRLLAGGSLPGAAGNPPGAGGSLLGLLEEPWDEGEVPEIVVAETIRARYQVANGRTNATFQSDLVPVRRSEVPGFLAVLALLRARLLALRDRIPREAYAFKSLPHRKTIEEQLRHMADCDRWYLTRLWDDLPRLGPGTSGRSSIGTAGGPWTSSGTFPTPSSPSSARKTARSGPRARSSGASPTTRSSTWIRASATLGSTWRRECLGAHARESAVKDPSGGPTAAGEPRCRHPRPSSETASPTRSDRTERPRPPRGARCRRCRPDCSRKQDR